MGKKGTNKHNKMTRALGIGDKSLDDEHDLEDDEERSHMLAELFSANRRRSARELFDAPSSMAGCGSSAARLWPGVLFLLSLVGAYHLGRNGGGHKVNANDAEEGKSSHDAFPGATFTHEHLKATRKEGEKILSSLEEYYFGKDQAFNMLMTPWAVVWDFGATAPGKRDRTAKLVDTMARALVTDEQKTFLMGGIGSSAMGGHDNCHYDSYQTQMERLWQPVWEAAGMNFVFQNAGGGGGCGDSHRNQHFCVKQNISPDVDIVHYSFNNTDDDGAHVEQENLVRWTQMLPKQPIVHILSVGKEDPASNPNHPFHQLVRYYAVYGHNIFGMRAALERGGHDYDSEKNREVNPFDRFGPGYVGDGYHGTTRYGELEDDAVRRDSLGVVMRSNAIPGPLGYQVASDAFTYVYTRALLKALDLIEKEMNDGKDPRDTWSASQRRVILKEDLPKPKYCDPEYCVVNEPPECLNYELPTFGDGGAGVEAPDGDSNPYKYKKQNWTVWHSPADLWYMVDGIDQGYYEHRDDKEMCRHLSACGGMTAQTVNDGMVVFRLPKMSVGLVIICGNGDGWADGAIGMFIKNEKIEISYNTVPLDRNEMDVFPDGKCARVMKRFPTSGRESQTPTVSPTESPFGHAYLAVKVLTDMPSPVLISHVITL